MRNKMLRLFVGCSLLWLPLMAINSAQAETPVAIEDTSAVGELAYWNKIKGSSDPAEIKLYIDTFPQGMFFDLALSKYLAAGGSPSDLDTAAAAPPPKVEEVVAEPADEVVDEQPTTYTKPKVKVQKRKQAYFKPKADYRKIQKVRYAIKKRAAKRYEPVVVYKRQAVKKRIVCGGYWSNGRCVTKAKYKVARVKYAKPKYYAPPKKKVIYDNYNDGGGQGSSGGGGGGGGWNN